jgi:hypothetical protein
MKVLCIDPRPTAHSETYISEEMSWMQRHGVEIGFWAARERYAPGPTDYETYEVKGTLAEANETFRPDVMNIYSHVHPAEVEELAHKALALGVPLTIRGHSFGFNVAVCRRLRAAARLWLFPHHAKLIDQENVEPLTVTYDPSLYFPEEPASARYVVRAATARPGKDLEGFLRLASMCPSIPFVLIVTSGDTGYLASLAVQAPSNASLYFNLDMTASAAIVRKGWVCLRSHDLDSHAYGMPVSIVEAMGAGLPIIARSGDPDSAARFGPESYVGDAGLYYRTDDEAVKLVQEVIEWSRDRWNQARSVALKQADQYRADVVLPRMLEVWRSLAT